MRMKKKGTLVVISGFSGAGKGTVCNRLKEKYGYSLSVSMTTRQPREGEQEGVEYYFRDESEFLRLIDYNGFIEFARYVDHYYGTPRQFVEDELEAGHVILLEIEVQGAVSIRNQYPDAVLIFITTPSVGELVDRLTGRGTESPEVIDKRMKRAAQEAMSIDEYAYIVCNEKDRLDECVEQVHAIIESSQTMTERNRAFIKTIQEELQDRTR